MKNHKFEFCRMLLVRHDSVFGDGRLHILCNRSETTICLPGTLKQMQILPSKVLYPRRSGKLCATSHLDKRFAVLWTDMTVFPIKYKTRVFKLRGGDINCNHDDIAFDEITRHLQVSTSSNKSLIHKMVKISTR